MITETFYDKNYLIHGICESCGEESDEIDTDSGMCIDCIETARFYQESMRMASRSYRALKDW